MWFFYEVFWDVIGQIDIILSREILYLFLPAILTESLFISLETSQSLISRANSDTMQLGSTVDSSITLNLRVQV